MAPFTPWDLPVTSRIWLLYGVKFMPSMAWAKWLQSPKTSCLPILQACCLCCKVAAQQQVLAPTRASRTHLRANQPGILAVCIPAPHHPSLSHTHTSTS